MQDLEPSNSALFWYWKGKPYSMPVSAFDWLTLARAVEREGYPSEAVAWTLLQRAAWQATHGGRRSLGQLVSAYAQPVNPLWFPDGREHELEMARLAHKSDRQGIEAENARAFNRVKYAQTPFSLLSKSTQYLILQIIRGIARSPVLGAVHYWQSRGPDFATNQAARPALKLRDYGFGWKGNVFFSENGSDTFGNIVVKRSSGDFSPSDSGGDGPLIAGIGLLVGVAAWKWFS